MATSRFPPALGRRCRWWEIRSRPCATARSSAGLSRTCIHASRASPADLWPGREWPRTQRDGARGMESAEDRRPGARPEGGHPARRAQGCASQASASVSLPLARCLGKLGSARPERSRSAQQSQRRLPNFNPGLQLRSRAAARTPPPFAGPGPSGFATRPSRPSRPSPADDLGERGV